MFQSAFSPVFFVWLALVLYVCVMVCWEGAIEAQSTFFPGDDSCPGHGADCKKGLGELQNTQTHTQTVCRGYS